VGHHTVLTYHGTFILPLHFCSGQALSKDVVTTKIILVGSCFMYWADTKPKLFYLAQIRVRRSWFGLQDFSLSLAQQNGEVRFSVISAKIVD